MHPNIYWDHQSKTIHWKQGNKSSALNTELKDAVDDELEKMWRLVNQRMHQSRFKKNISYLYNGRCAISGSSVPEVLDAAHISGHKVSGNNKNKNGILMRTDLHRLFDRNLLLIHPDRLTVHLHPGIKDKTYTTFEGQPISKPKNDNLPAKEFLQEKWNNAGWTTNL
jgi:predicted restriction endonuclease